MSVTYVDHVNREVTIPSPPKRIISLCPSITETLYALQLSSQIVGRTRYCIHPKDEIHQAMIVGGTKQIKKDLIDQLKPDLIIAEKEENPKEMVELLEKDYPVFVANVENYEEALRMIHDVGKITNRMDQAEEITQQIKREFSQIQPSIPYRVAYMIWKKPYMVVAKPTYIHAMLEQCGFINVFKDYDQRYPMIEVEDLEKVAPDYIFLSSEPYPFQTQHLEGMKEEYPHATPVLVDGEMFSWYGVRMLKAASYFRSLIDQLENTK